MDVLAVLLALIAIVMAFIALQRTGGLKDLRQQIDALSSKTEDATKGARETTADALRHLEQLIRGREEQPPDHTNKPPTPPEQGAHP
ncbi:MAG: hypothetical protein OEV01_00105 [Nitrospira sp.]|nr:hypothetical protein [Nitrospira sp.]MDH4303430.1 hypothetical protein [Nitrospira sp.]MDH5192107.1 hypothetical protein [Nitrospira sp.]